ncbi:hypothetical protein CPC08DRAFT_767000 [Agrocybe pediades]|nr:hypothetical protein CPC08DRAFT_767000 [Agrocybe pediades]
MNTNLGSTIGAAYLGSVGACILYGATLMQGYTYFVNYPNDWLFQKIMVTFLLVMDTMHLIITTVVIYHYCINEFGNKLGLMSVVWSFKLQIVFNVIIVITVQSLYLLRIWKLGRRFNKLWPYIALLIQCGGYVVGILLAVETYKLRTWLELDGMGWVVNATFSTSTGIDIILAASMCYYLHRSKSSFISTNHRIVSIMRYVLATGSLTSASSLCSLITYVIMPNNFVFLGVSFLVTKLYTNSYLVMLNARRSIRGDKDSTLTMKRLANMINGPGNESTDAEVNTKDPLQISSVSYRTRLEESPDVDAKYVHQKNPSSNGVIDIKVSRTEETIFDGTDIKGWNRV